MSSDSLGCVTAAVQSTKAHIPITSINRLLLHCPLQYSLQCKQIAVRIESVKTTQYVLSTLLHVETCAGTLKPP